jgi:hypothetical protein
MARRKDVLDGIAATARKRDVVIPSQLSLLTAVGAAPVKGTAESDPLGVCMRSLRAYFARPSARLVRAVKFRMSSPPCSTPSRYSSRILTVPRRHPLSDAVGVGGAIGRVCLLALGALVIAALILVGGLSVTHDVGADPLRISLLPSTTRCDSALTELGVLSESPTPQGCIVNISAGSASVMRGLIAETCLTTRAEGHTSETTPLFLSTDAETNHQKGSLS